MSLGGWRNFHKIITSISLFLLMFCFWGIYDEADQSGHQSKDRAAFRSTLLRFSNSIKSAAGMFTNQINGKTGSQKDVVTITKGDRIYYFVIKQSR